jgi:hypothetical protein
MGVVINQLVDLLREIARERRAGGMFRDVAELRKGAVSAVAERYGVEPNTIADAFIRRLRPHIASTEEFDQAVALWFRGRPETLRRALLQRASTRREKEKVAAVIDQVT